MAPITNAPNAVEKPANAASTTIPKHKPTATTQRVSSVIHRRIHLRNVGIKKIPNVNHTIRKNTSFTMLNASSPPSKLFPTLNVERTTNSSTAIRSSTTSTAVTVPVKRCCFSFKSSNDLIIIVVDEIESMQPRNTQSIVPMPSRCPTVLPATNITASSVSAVMAPVAPTRFNFLTLNSRPKANIKNTIPMSLHTCTLLSSVTAGNHGKYGPIKKPATMYPRTKGCFSHLNTTVITPAVIRITARSTKIGGNDDIFYSFSLILSIF